MLRFTKSHAGVIQNGEVVDFESQSLHVNCDGDSGGFDFSIELVGFDLTEAATRTKLVNTVLQPGENPFEALGISGVR